MRPAWALGLTVALALTAGSGMRAAAVQEASTPRARPDAAIGTPPDLGRHIREALEADAKIQSQYTYVERRRDVKMSRLGKVTIGPLRTFEVYPTADGDTYKRLIAVDGKPLTPEELARRDAQHQRELEREEKRRRNESPAERAERERTAQEERRHRQAMLDDLIRVFQATVVGRETIAGERVLVADVKPRTNASVTTREGRWMKAFEGRIWVDESDYQIVKLDMRATEDVTIGWGIIGRLHAGSGAIFSRRHVDGYWLPAELTYRASGRTLLFRPFEFEVTTTYSDYKRQR